MQPSPGPTQNASTPRVSIGLPVYNGERFLRKTIESFRSQTYADFELLISDNCSTDQTENISRKYCEKDPRIKYERHSKNRGAAWNYNRVFTLACGEFFKWAADDDLCRPDFLAKCLEVLDTDKTIVLACSGVNYINYDDEILEKQRSQIPLDSPQIPKRFHAIVCQEGCCSPVFGLIRRDALSKTRLIGGYVASDRVLLAELSLIGRFWEIREPLFLRRLPPPDSERAYSHRRAERATWFSPKNKGRKVLPECRLFGEYFRAIHQASLRLQDRLACYKELLRWLHWGHGRAMVTEFQRAYFSY